ncbi:MAG: UDP-glucose 4-epimerase GalE [Clostridiales bacterium]|jgi:UDP-glucose 4-epimerase|nr:UDP-glucose 4-epimerase GalE [Clostridiales bacterium]
MAILITGGAGYIGSHTAVELLNSGYEIIVIDNFYNSSKTALERVKSITNKNFKFYEGDILDKDILNCIFSENKIDSVIHFAGLKAVGESSKIPLKYYENNVTGTITLCKVMAEHNCKKLVFSSSATVYGGNNVSPLKEEMPVGATTNPYGTSKYMIELILTDLQKSDSDFGICLLRYFNPIGAHESGLIGEDPNGIPNNLMPRITQTAVGKFPYLTVFGTDYDTHDGTGVRDYIHVVDLAKGHIKAVLKLQNTAGLFTYNLGTGTGYSVYDLVKAFEKASGLTIPCKVEKRRAGDIAVCYSDPSKAEKELNWKAEKTLDDMCADSYRWQKNNPNGYGK